MGSLSNFQEGQGGGGGRVKDRTGWQEQPGLLLCCHSSGHKAAKSLQLSNVHYAIVNDAITYHMFSSMAGFIQLIQMQD